MKKLTTLLLTVLLMMSLGIVAQAQDEEEQGTILDIASETEDLSTLVAAVEAADPAIAETLGNEGEYTVLAPTNQAFENLLITLDITADELFDHPLLTDILSYHVLQGEFFAEDIAELDGSFAETTLADNFVSVSVAEDGTIVLNDVVNVQTADVDASNGVVHVIDDVLLPQRALEAFLLAEPDNANVQVMHFSPDAPNVDVYVDGAVAISDLAFGSTSGYMTLPADDYEIAVAPAGTSIEDAVIGPATLTLEAGNFANIAAIGSVEAETLTITRFEQDFPTLDENEVAVTLLHAVEGAPDVDVVVNDAVSVEGLAYPFTSGDNDGVFNAVITQPIDSLTVNVAGEDTVLLDLSDSSLDVGNYYIVVVGGTGDAPSPYVFTIGSERAEELEDALYEDETENEEMEATEEAVMPSATIADIVTTSATAEDPQFTILLQAIQNADPAVLEALQGDAPLTVFAPTDEAFNNLLSSTGLTVDELLESDLLTDILLYHVVNGTVNTDAINEYNNDIVPTLLADTYIGVTITEDGTVVLNDIANVVQTDIEASNGIIHVIDEVILPSEIVAELGL